MARRNRRKRRPTTGRIRTWLQRLAAAALAIAVAAPNPAAAAIPAPTGNARWYYHIGGADAVLPAANAGVTTVTIGGSLDLGLGLSCKGFNPVANLASAMTGAVDKIKAVVTNAAASLVSALPGLIVQRASPSLYELYQEIVSYAEAAVSLSTKSCEQMQSDMARGKNPLDDWITASRKYSWKDQAGRVHGGTQTYSSNQVGDMIEGNHSEANVVDADKAVDANGDKAGVPWVDGGRAGGDAARQRPIQVVRDVVSAGYNLELGRGATDAGAATPSQRTDTRIAQLWGQPGDAADFAVAVLGDIRIQSGAPAATPGHGLGPRIQQDRTDFTEALGKLVRGETSPTPDELAKVSAPGTRLTRGVLDAIRKLPAGDQPVAVGKLAAEAATAVNVEKALMVRRLLLTGAQEPNVYASPAAADIERLVKQIDREIDQLLYETRIRRELFAGTAGALLDLGQGLDGRGVTPYRPGDSRPVVNGAVRP